MGAGDVIMAVPGAGIKLDEAHALLYQLPCQQAAASQVVGWFCADPVKFSCGGGFVIDIDNLRHLRLHTKCQFVVSHAGDQFLVLGMPCRMLLVE